MSNFEEAFKITLKHEGGYVNDPDDRGGETYRGIARKIWPDWAGWNLIKDIKVKYNIHTKAGYSEFVKNIDASMELNAEVKDFYKEKFWDKLKLDLVKNALVAYELFDTAVNQGVRTASKYLQISLNLLNRDQKDWPDIKVDGIVGNNTINVLNTCVSKGKRWVSGLLKCLNGEQYYRYRALALISSKQEKFMHGWLKRVSFGLTD